MTHQHELIRNAHVEISQTKTAKGVPVAVATIDDRFQHRFSPKSRISKHLELMSSEDLGQRMSGGHYFFINDELVRFRDGSYGDSFVHTDASISAFMDTLGVIEGENPLRSNRRQTDEDAPQFFLSKVWSNGEITVPEYKQGGMFTSRLIFNWDPFVKTINSAFEIVRLICENGNIGTTSFLNTKIPLMNRWQEHLDIASKQIQNKVNSTVAARISEMGKQRTSVALCSLVENHIAERLSSPLDRSYDERNRLRVLQSLVSPQLHLSHIYSTALFEDKNLSSQVPAHLTAFDLYNIATETRSHSWECSKSSAFALDRIANQLLFDEDSNYSVGTPTAKLAAFSNSQQAFFANIH